MHRAIAAKKKIKLPLFQFTLGQRSVSSSIHISSHIISQTVIISAPIRTQNIPWMFLIPLHHMPIPWEWRFLLYITFQSQAFFFWNFCPVLKCGYGIILWTSHLLYTLYVHTIGRKVYTEWLAWYVTKN